MDATAALAIGQRRGLGKVKHLDKIWLWVQEIVNQGKAKLEKVHTTKNLSDVLTKAVSGADLRRFVEEVGFEYLSGRASLGYRP